MPVNSLDDKDELIRYIDFSKFMYLIRQKKLYFPRADCFEDKFEGYYTKIIYEIGKEIVIEADDKPPNKGLYKNTIMIKESSYVSCWTKCQYESMAHWDIYGGENSVAIITLVGELKKQLKKAEAKGFLTFMEREIEEVEYIDHHSIDEQLVKELLKNKTNPLKMKNIAFEYEKEVRVIYNHMNHLAKNNFNEKLGKGFYIDIDPSKLISRIVVSPKADNWFYALVKKLMSDYLLPEIVERSKLHITPFEEAFRDK
jgi:hypothetical protein